LELNKNSIVKNDITLTHATGVTKMVNISSKESTFRYAKASCYVITNKDVIILVNEDKNKKGDVIKTAEIAGIVAAKNTYKLIPLCHFVNLTTCQIKISTLDDRFFIETYVETVNQTGVEMEAIISCTIAAATIYDMCKSADKSILITNIKLDEKFGGKSGHFINRSQII
jgi:cyclic pyranopterin phosphate synthase